MITAEQALTLLKGSNILRAIYTTPEHEEALDMAITALEAQQADRWIPITDHNPDSDRVVQVYIRRKDGVRGRYVTNACYVAPKTQTTDDYGWEDIDGIYDEDKDCYWVPECWYEDNMISDNGNWVLTGEFDILKWRELPTPWKEEQ